MKSMILVALALVAVAAAAPVDEPIQIVRSNFNQEPAGGYQYGFESQNGIVREEKGELKTVKDEDNKDHEVVVVRGFYTYPGEDGTPININYEADENGYRAVGDSIPKTARR